MKNRIVLERTELWYYGGTSDKVYNVTIYHNTTSNTFTVEAEYGRRGNNNLAISEKYQGGNRGAAWVKYKAAVDSKTKKGYDVTDVNKGDLQHKVDTYKRMVYKLTAEGVITYQQRVQLDALLDSGDTESINTAIQIVDVKQEKQVA
jgi:hypothetical protein